jgi:hypothetical protein
MMLVTSGATDVTTYFHLRLAADGTDATGLTITNIDLQYVRSRVAPAAKADATALAATDSAHGDNQAIEIDATDQPGVYRVDWPDAAFAAGVDEVILTVKCATAFTESLRVRLMSATRGLTGTALPDAAFGAAGGLFDDAVGAHSLFGIVDSGTAQSVGANDIVLRSAAAFVDDALNGCTVVITNGTQVGERTIITDYVGATDTATLGNGWTGATPSGTPTYKIFGSAAGAGVAQTGDCYARLGAPAGASVSADIAAVKVDTAAILVDTGTTLDGKIDTIDTVVDAVKAKTDSLTYTVANVLDANVQRVNDVALIGDGDATPWGPA